MAYNERLDASEAGRTVDRVFTVLARYGLDEHFPLARQHRARGIELHDRAWVRIDLGAETARLHNEVAAGQLDAGDAADQIAALEAEIASQPARRKHTLAAAEQADLLAWQDLGKDDTLCELLDGVVQKAAQVIEDAAEIILASGITEDAAAMRSPDAELRLAWSSVLLAAQDIETVTGLWLDLVRNRIGPKPLSWLDEHPNIAFIYRAPWNLPRSNPYAPIETAVVHAVKLLPAKVGCVSVREADAIYERFEADKVAAARAELAAR